MHFRIFELIETSIKEKTVCWILEHQETINLVQLGQVIGNVVRKIEFQKNEKITTIKMQYSVQSISLKIYFEKKGNIKKENITTATILNVLWDYLKFNEWPRREDSYHLRLHSKLFLCLKLKNIFNPARTKLSFLSEFIILVELRQIILMCCFFRK